MIRPLLACLLGAVLAPWATVPSWAAEPDPLILFDPATAQWHVRGPDGVVQEFVFGEPGDVPLWGDWECAGRPEAALFRPADNVVILRSAPERTYPLAVPGAFPLVGDFDGDGCDSVSAYQFERVSIINRLGGPIEAQFSYGVPSDVPLAGDFDGDGISTIGVHRPALARVFLRNSLDTGAADVELAAGEPGDLITVGDWDGDGTDTLALYRPDDRAYYVTDDPTGDGPFTRVAFGEETWVPPARPAGPAPAVRARWVLLLITAVTVAAGGAVGRRGLLRLRSPEGNTDRRHRPW